MDDNISSGQIRLNVSGGISEIGYNVGYDFREGGYEKKQFS